MLTIDRDTARRFVLGKQGLWPGRRQRGLTGVEQTMREIEYLQLDPLQMIARSHDIQLHSRVLDYRPGLWETAAYDQRKFFDWGGWLSTRPMEELPYWRVVMHRERDGHADCDPRICKRGVEYAEVLAEMRGFLQEQDVVANRDFAMAERTRTQSYRGRKDSAVALYHLWRTGEVMTYNRENFERIYALTEQVAPPHLLYEKDGEEVDRFLIKKEVSFVGLSRLPRTGDAFQRGVPFSRKQELSKTLLADHEIVEVSIAGWRGVYYALAADVRLLDEVAGGRIPPAWRPLAATTQDEAVFLAPLDPVIARGRAKQLFGVEYVWEVYKPKEKRRFGYYVLPILWGDELVGRFDSKFDRATNTFVILGLWLEDDNRAKDERFAEALARGMARFGNFLDADVLDIGLVDTPLLRQCVALFEE